MRNVLSILVLVVVLGCAKKKEKDAPPPTVSSGSPAANAPAVVVDAAEAPPPPPAKAELLPEKLGEKEGIVFSEKAGEQVTAKVKGQSVLIPDLTLVEIMSEKEAMAGSGEEASITVKYDGKEVELLADRVLRESELARSPTNKWAVFAPTTGCGDVCHTVLYLLGKDGKRTKLGDGGVDVVLSWRADKVAIGSSGLWVVALPDQTVKHLEKYTSPKFGPTGVLYVRDHDGNAYTLDGDKAKQVWKAPKKPPGGDDELLGDMDPEPVHIDEKGKPLFQLTY